MKIGELAKTAQCTVETIRHYEKVGLLPRPKRGGNNYRLYERNHLQQLQFIRNCRALDMSQEEIQDLLALKDKSDSECSSIRALLDDHISHVDARIAVMQRLKNDLALLRRKCRTGDKIRDCRILKGLSTMRAPGKISRMHL